VRPISRRRHRSCLTFDVRYTLPQIGENCRHLCKSLLQVVHAVTKNPILCTLRLQQTDNTLQIGNLADDVPEIGRRILS
jgi:predicted amidohydrolase